MKGFCCGMGRSVIMDESSWRLDVSRVELSYVVYRSVVGDPTHRF